MQGKLIIISAPSGAGKTTIVHAVLHRLPELEFSISACSRPMRNNEVDGRDYYFIGVEEFRKKIEENAFLEWQEVYKDHYYGTLRSEVERIWQKGKHVIFDLDVYGGVNLKKQFSDQALAIFIMPPSVEVLEERLRNRSTDSDIHIMKRLEKARLEITKAGEFDSIVVNKDLDTAIAGTLALIKEFIR